VVFLLQFEWEILISIGFIVFLVCLWACKRCWEEDRKVDRLSYTTRTSSSRSDHKKYQSASVTQTIQLAMCPECEATIQADEVVCPHCGTPQPICSVCQHSIKHGETILICPHCNSQAHRLHILEYLKVKGTCPNCEEDLDEFELLEPDVHSGD